MRSNLRSPISAMLVLQWMVMGLVSGTNISTEEEKRTSEASTSGAAAPYEYRDNTIWDFRNRLTGNALPTSERNEVSEAVQLIRQDNTEAGQGAEVVDTDTETSIRDQQRLLPGTGLDVSDAMTAAVHHHHADGHVRGRRAVVIRGPFYPYPAARKSGASTVSAVSTCCLLVFAVKIL